MTTVALKEKHWCGRTLLVTCGDGRTYTVEYSPWGVGRESVFVDGAVAVRRSGGGRMSHGYRFWLGDTLVSLSVAIPWWAEALPLCDLSFVRLEVEGVIVYEEGRPPDHPLQWTVASGGFPVIENFPWRGSDSG